MKKLISRRNFLKVCALAGSAAAPVSYTHLTLPTKLEV